MILKQESINIIMKWKNQFKYLLIQQEIRLKKETYSDIIKILNQSLKNYIYNKFNTKDSSCNKIYMSRPLFNSICKALFNSNQNSKILIDKESQ